MKMLKEKHKLTGMHKKKQNSSVRGRSSNMKSRNLRNYKKGYKIMTHVNSMEKYTTLGSIFNQDPPFVKINMVSQ
jgi:hypothetical protein